MERRDHARAGGDAVVDHDGDAPRRVGGGASRCVLGAALAQELQLDRFLSGEIGRVGATHGGVRGNIGPAGLVDRAHCELRAVRRAQLLHQRHVELAVELARDHRPHRYCAARDREHQGIAAAVPGERPGEALSGVEPGIEQGSHETPPKMRRL